MALPKIESPKYHLTIPSTGDVIEYRPFLVAEEKILLIAQETGTQLAMITALKDIIKACTFNKLTIEDLAMYDLEYIFLQLRAKSVGETSEISIKCNECEEYVPVTIDLSEVEVKGTLSDGNIKITDTVGVTLKAPGIKQAIAATKVKNSDPIHEAIASVIDTIYDDNDVYPVADSSPKELEEFINSLSHSQLTKIQEWVDTMPTISHDVEFTCKNGHKNKRTLSGLADFFA